MNPYNAEYWKQELELLYQALIAENNLILVDHLLDAMRDCKKELHQIQLQEKE